MEGVAKRIVTKEGVVTSLRYFGDLAFGYLDGNLRFSVQKSNIGKNFFKFKDSTNVGDSVRLSGTMSKKFGENLMEVKGVPGTQLV